MCGLAGLFTTRLESPEDIRTAAQRMADRLLHRGPDDGGVWVHPSARLGFGFRRLAILDLSEQGHQPMASQSGRFTIVFNGEVYNFLELRTELERAGVRFRGHSDTETILAAFEVWGIAAAVPRFVGMFAMAVWDEQERSLTLIRDRLGIKPMFIYHRPGHVMFASELKAIMAGPGFDGELDQDAIHSFLRYLYVPAPASIFAHVTKLMPGHALTIRDPRQPLPPSEAYWSVESAMAAGIANPFSGSDSEAVAELERVLRDAVRLRLISDVPIGTLLSGGVDSSLITALAQQQMGRALKTFSIGFDVPEYNEAPAAAAVARHLGTDHTELTVAGSDMLNLVPRLPDIFDEPLANASQLPTLVVSQMARRVVTVALAGDGGDELFGGYHRYIEGGAAIDRLSRLPARARRLAGRSAGHLSARTWDRAYRLAAPVLPRALQHRLAGEKISKVAGLMQQHDAAGMYDFLLAAGQADGPRRSVTAVHRIFADHSEASLLDRMMLADQSMYLPDDLLAKVDRASMAVSLEVRVPILDHRVVEFSWRLDARHKVRDGRGKWALREILYRHVPRQLIDRPKMGFTVPVAAWLSGPLRGWAEDLLFGSNGHGVSPELVFARQRWSDLQRGHTGVANGVWALLALQDWRRRWSV